MGRSSSFRHRVAQRVRAAETCPASAFDLAPLLVFDPVWRRRGVVDRVARVEAAYLRVLLYLPTGQREQLVGAHPTLAPAARRRTRPDQPIGWIRQRIESIVNSLKDQLLLQRHAGRTPAGLLACVTARVLALCACVNQHLGRPSRELTAYAD